MSLIEQAARLCVASCLAIGLAATAARSQSSLPPPSYTAAQAQRGAAIYVVECASCHGENLDDGQFALPLKGPAFRQRWGAKGLDGPFTVMTQQMPPTNPGGLGPAAYADVLAFVLSKNGVAATTTELPADASLLKGMAAPR